MQCPQGSNREPSLARWGEGHGRGEALGNAAPKNPAAYGTLNGGRVVVGTGETRLRPSSETAREADRAGGLGATNPISGAPDEMGESGAGVGGGHSSDEGVDNRTRRSEGPLAECAAQLARQRDCREAIHPPDHVSEGRLLGCGANACGGAECRASTARGRAVCGRIACTVRRGRAGNGAATATAPALYSTALAQG